MQRQQGEKTLCKKLPGPLLLKEIKRFTLRDPWNYPTYQVCVKNHRESPMRFRPPRLDLPHKSRGLIQTCWRRLAFRLHLLISASTPAWTVLSLQTTCEWMAQCEQHIRQHKINTLQIPVWPLQFLHTFFTFFRWPLSFTPNFFKQILFTTCAGEKKNMLLYF